MSWEEATLGQIATLNYGKSLPARSRQEGPFPVYGSGGVGGYHSKPLVKGPGIILGRKGTVGSVFWEPNDFFAIDTAYHVAPKADKVRLKYLYYLLKHLPLSSMNSDAAVPGLNRDNAYAVKVSLPDLPTQERIASILSAYDDLIENNRRRIALLEQAARLLYREWFVHFRFPGHETARFKDGLPEGWDKLTYGDVFDFLGGFAFKSSTYTEDGQYGIVTIKNVHDAKFIQDCSSRVGDIPRKMKPHCRLETGDILLSLTGNVGRACVVVGDDYLLNQRVAKVIGKNGIPKPFVYWCFSNPDTIKELENLAYGVAQLNLSPVQLSRRPFVRPPDEILAEFDAIASTMLDQIVALTKQTSQLTAARDLLLPRLMDGRIPVSV